MSVTFPSQGKAYICHLKWAFVIPPSGQDTLTPVTGDLGPLLPPLSAGLFLPLGEGPLSDPCQLWGSVGLSSRRTAPPVGDPHELQGSHQAQDLRLELLLLCSAKPVLALALALALAECTQKMEREGLGS